MIRREVDTTLEVISGVVVAQFETHQPVQVYTEVRQAILPVLRVWDCGEVI